MYSDKEAAATRLEARRDFDEAERRMPQSADAHLAMARIYVYSMPDLAKAPRRIRSRRKAGREIRAARNRRSRRTPSAFARSNWHPRIRVRPGTRRKRRARSTGVSRDSIEPMNI